MQYFPLACGAIYAFGLSLYNFLSLWGICWVCCSNKNKLDCTYFVFLKVSIKYSKTKKNKKPTQQLWCMLENITQLFNMIHLTKVINLWSLYLHHRWMNNTTSVHWRMYFLNCSFNLSEIITGIWFVAELHDTSDDNRMNHCSETKHLQQRLHRKNTRKSPETNSDPHGPTHQRVKFLLISERPSQQQVD